jgi:hypothetical protein
MPLKGRFKEGELRIAQVQVDFLKQPMSVYVLAAYVDPKVGNTLAWIPAQGVMWSKETATALTRLVQCMERDVASAMMVTGASSPESDTQRTGFVGIGERVSGASPDAPQM